MVPSSSFVQHHELSDVFLQPVSFEQKAEHHVEESSGKDNRRGTCGSETEVSMFDTKKPTERKAKPLLQNRLLHTARGIKSWAEILFQGARGNLCETGSRTQQRILKRAQEMNHHNMQIPDERCIGKVLKNLGTEVESSGEWILDQETDILIWDYLCQQRRKQNFILGQITIRIWLCTGTPFSRSSRRCSTLHRCWSWNENSRFWMFPRWMDFSPWMRGPLCWRHSDQIRRKQKYTSTQIQFFMSVKKCPSILKQMKDGKIKLEDFQQPNAYRELLGNRWRTNRVRMEYVLRTYKIGDSQRDAGQKWQFVEQVQNILKVEFIFMLMFNEIDWTKNEKFSRMSFEFQKRSRNTRKGFAWTLAIPQSRRRRHMVWNAHLQTWRTVEFYFRCHGGNFQRKRTSDIPRYQCVKWRGPEEEIRKMYDSLHCGICWCRAAVSHNSLCKAAQYLRSNRQLVWRFG